MKAQPFRGQFLAKIDAKSRLALPVAIRTSLPENKRLVVTNSIYRNRKCLDLYTLEAWLALEEKIARLPSLNANVQAFQRFYLSAGIIIEMDAQNRLLLPKNLKSFAGLDLDLVLVGMGNKLEIWNKNSWDDLQTELSISFEEIVAGVSELEEGQE